MLPRSLRHLTLLFLLAFLLATLGTGFVTYSATLSTIERLVDRRISLASDGVAGDPADRQPAAIMARIARFTRERDTGDIGVLLLDQHGRRLAGNITLSRRLPIGFSTLRVDDRITGLSAGRALVRDIGGGITLATIAETEPFDDYAGARQRIYLLGFGSIIAIVLAGLVAFGVLIQRRIREMRLTVDAIIDGDMGHRVPVDRAGGTFADQAGAFNRMLDRIADLMAGISSVSNDIAHDLRTPLARLRSRLALSLRRAETPAQRSEIEEAIALSEELLAMFAAILRIAEVDGGDRRGAFAALDLADLVSDIGATMAPVVAEDGRTLTLGSLAPVAVVGDRQLLSQALVNLIENAIRHTPPGTRIAVALSSAHGMAVLTITDSGPGISAAERPLALRRFGRLDASRHSAGHGLGLPLVDSIARLHRGTLMLEDAARGLRVVLRLPLA